MQIFASCMECQKELGHPSFEPFFAPYYEDRLTYINCSRGHRSALILQSQKFEVLMESGANALASDFTLEASASFSAALERFYEFCLRVVFTHRKVANATYEKMFNAMSRHSERQAGAFLALIAIETGIVHVANPKIAEFRNSVIHQGLIPIPEQAEAFCSKVYLEVITSLALMRKHFSEAIDESVARDVGRRSRLVEPGTPIATSSGVSFFNICNTENTPTFNEAFATFKNQHKHLLEAVPRMRELFEKAHGGGRTA